MSSLKRDTEPCVYIRFQTNEHKMEVFQKMFLQATKYSLPEVIKGVSKEAGNISIITSFIAPIGNNEQAKRAFVASLNNVFIKLFDFYPSISEKPSDLQALSVGNFINDYAADVAENSPVKVPVFN